MAKDDKYKENYDLYYSYYQASREVYHFFRDLFFDLNPRMCVVQEKTETSVEEPGEEPGEVEFLDFEKLRETIGHHVTIYDCDDTVVSAHLEEQNKTLVKAVGHYFYDVRRSSDENHPLFAIVETVGFQHQKHLLSLYFGRPPARHLIHRGFRPSFADEPDFREQLLSLLSERIWHGISTASLGYPEHSRKFLPSYKLEGSILNIAMSALREGLNLPYGVNNRENEKRNRAFTVSSWSKTASTGDIPLDMSDESVLTTDVGTQVYGAYPKHDFAYETIKKRDELYQGKLAVDLLVEGSLLSEETVGILLDKDKVLSFLRENGIVGLTSGDLNKTFNDLQGTLVASSNAITIAGSEHHEWEGFLDEFFEYEKMLRRAIAESASTPLDQTIGSYLERKGKSFDPINFPTLETRVDAFIGDKLNALALQSYDEAELRARKEEFEENKDEKEAHLTHLTDILRRMSFREIMMSR